LRDANRDIGKPADPGNGENMQNNKNSNAEPWMEICELAAREQNPTKLMELTTELIRLLDEKRNHPSNLADPPNIE
jgi:hypothetical protein